jgi:O-antigen/teichoic acid export membrane protein
MNAERAQLTRSTLWLLLANIFRNVGLIALLILVARYTNPTVLGEYSLALAISAPVFVFAELGLRTVYLTLHQPIAFRHYLLLRTGMGALAFLVSVAIAALFVPQILSTVALVAAVKLADSFSDLLSAPMQFYRRPELITAAYAGLAVVGTAVVWLLLEATRSLDVALTGLLGVSIATALAMTAPARRLLVAHRAPHDGAPRASLRTLFRAGMPTGVSWSLLSLVSTVPQYFLAWSHARASVGFFAVLLYIVAAVELFMNALTQAWIPQGRALHARAGDDPARFTRSVAVFAGWWTAAFVPLAVLGVWIAALVFPLLFGPEYVITVETAAPIVLSVVALPAVFFGSMALSIQNRYTHGLALGLSAAVVSVAACAALIPAFGVPGALWATFLAYVARAATSFLLASRRSARERSAIV